MRPVAALRVEIVDGESAVGGGSAPGVTLPARLISLQWQHGAARLEQQLRMGDPPVISRIEDERVLLDLRTVLPEEDDVIFEVVTRLGP